MMTPELQPGMTHIRLAQAKEDVLAGALRIVSWVRIEKDAKTNKTKKKPAPLS